MIYTPDHHTSASEAVGGGLARPPWIRYWVDDDEEELFFVLSLQIVMKLWSECRVSSDTASWT